MSLYKVAMVSGATGGIGSAIAKELVNNGLKVVLCGRNDEKLSKLVNELGNDNVLHYETFDINDYEAMKQFVNNIKVKNIFVDALINNAGLALGLSSFEENDMADNITMIDTNVKSLMQLTYLMLKDMKKENHGIIINIGSIAGQVAYANGSVYCATKAAVETFSDGIRIDLMKTNIKVTNIQPGIVETDFSLVRFKGDEEKAKKVYTGIEALCGEDVANAVGYVINQPLRVQIGEISILANQQGSGFAIHRD